MPRHPISLEPGQRFGRLVVVAEAERQAPSRAYRWLCRCDCGAVVSIAGFNLRSGNTSSCGCLAKERLVARSTTHNLTRQHPYEYKTWARLRRRCSNPDEKDYADYGGRGIAVCPEWADFAVFFRDMGPRPSLRHSIDRIDNDGPYSPENCRWATPVEQRRNRRDVTLLACGGRSMLLRDWARETGISESTITHRLRRGWSIERALTHPVRPIKKPVI
jgi:hypothetical protein